MSKHIALYREDILKYSSALLTVLTASGETQESSIIEIFPETPNTILFRAVSRDVFMSVGIAVDHDLDHPIFIEGWRFMNAIRKSSGDVIEIEFDPNKKKVEFSCGEFSASLKTSSEDVYFPLFGDVDHVGEISFGVLSSGLKFLKRYVPQIGSRVVNITPKNYMISGSPTKIGVFKSSAIKFSKECALPSFALKSIYAFSSMFPEISDASFEESKNFFVVYGGKKTTFLAFRKAMDCPMDVSSILEYPEEKYIAGLTCNVEDLKGAISRVAVALGKGEDVLFLKMINGEPKFLEVSVSGDSGRTGVERFIVDEKTSWNFKDAESSVRYSYVKSILGYLDKGSIEIRFAPSFVRFSGAEKYYSFETYISKLVEQDSASN